jgi:hypothetical protein
VPVVFPPSGFGRPYQQTAKNGVTVTASATPHTQGAWTTLIGSLSYDVFGVALRAWGVSGSNTNTGMLANIGVSPAGGGSEQIVIPYLDFGAADVLAGSGKDYFFPLYIPAGKDLRAQIQAVVVSDTVVMNAAAFELPPHGFAEDAPQEWTQYGAVSASTRGTAVTSGSNAYGTEAQITASTTRAHRWFHVGLDFAADTVVAAGGYRVRLARDTGGADVIGIWDFRAPSASENIIGPRPNFPACCPVAAGSTLYIDVDGQTTEALGVIVYAA